MNIVDAAVIDAAAAAGPAPRVPQRIAETDPVLSELIGCTAIEFEGMDGQRWNGAVRGIVQGEGRIAFATADARELETRDLRALWLPPATRSDIDHAPMEAITQLDYRDGKTVAVRSARTRSSPLGVLISETRTRQLLRRFVPWAALSGFQVLGAARATESTTQPADVFAKAVSAVANVAGAHNGKDAWRQKAELLGLTTLEESQLTPTQAVLDQIPAELAREIHVLPLRMEDGRMHVAIADPTDPDALAMLSFLFNRAPILEVASAEAIDRTIGRVYSTLNDVPVLLDESQPPADDPTTMIAGLERLANDAPIVRLVNNILVEAIRRSASDVHIRPGGEWFDLVFRIDGDLTFVRRIPKKLLMPVVARIKVMGRMDITKHRVPQDGQARMRDGTRAMDMRISVIPTIEGESVVIRLLTPTFELKSIEGLGLSENDTRQLDRLLQRTSGMVLVTGPTGSGKSTTLYAALKTVMAGNVNIITVENPVEYRIAGIQQVPVSIEQGLTFAKALRNILRHDPDVIMVGEIRDNETARIAIESGLTGHLVLSTLHTNSAVGTMSRLIEMGIDDYLIRATLLAVIAQRLVRTICPACREPDEPGAELRALSGAGTEETFYHGAGCNACQGRGYRGRRMSYELLLMTPALRRLIREGVDADAVQQQAIADGMLPLTEHALAMARNGDITLAEAYLTRID